ncbi:MAG: glucokinase [Rhodobacteraceae bacterium]|nr:glucokinase [Paracoccaceae bacterium]
MPDRATPDASPVLLADIGGTNTRVALARGGQVQHDTIRRFANAEYPGLPPILMAYLAEMRVDDCAGACIAAAGLVQDGVAEMTNLSWVIAPGDVTAATGAAHVAILNDLQAQGHAIDGLAPASLRPLLPGAARPRHGARLVIGVGTGFNAAPVHRGRAGLLVVPSECGHASLPLRNEEDLRLARFVEAAHGFAGVEDVLSGRGLERLYSFCAKEVGQQADLSAAEIMTRIAVAADPLARHAATLFARFLGRVSGDLALIHLPYGGIYLVGGVARAFAPYLTPDHFGTAFHEKGRFSSFLADFSVQVIEDDYAALQGCAAHLAAEMGQTGP